MKAQSGTDQQVFRFKKDTETLTDERPAATDDDDGKRARCLGYVLSRRPLTGLNTIGRWFLTFSELRNTKCFIRFSRNITVKRNITNTFCLNSVTY